MTRDCLDTDGLVSVAAALEWDVPARLDHLAACERCRQSLNEMVLLHAELTAVEALPARSPAVEWRPWAPAAPSPAEAQAPADAVLVPPTGFAARAAERFKPGHRLAAAATFVVAGVTTLVLSAVLLGPSAGPSAFVLAALVGAAAVAPPLHRSSQPA